MKSMALTADEAKEEYGECAPCSTSSEDSDDAPKYPWGLSLCLDEKSLAKLGIGLIPVGTEVIIMAKATITGTSTRERVKGKPHQDMDIQITALDVTPTQADRQKSAAAKLYPDAD